MPIGKDRWTTQKLNASGLYYHWRRYEWHWYCWLFYAFQDQSKSMSDLFSMGDDLVVFSSFWSPFLGLLNQTSLCFWSTELLQSRHLHNREMSLFSSFLGIPSVVCIHQQNATATAHCEYHSLKSLTELFLIRLHLWAWLITCIW